MAQTKLYAPEGQHFMVNKNGGFYLMKNPKSGYKSHKSANGERSSLYILVELKSYHATGSVSKSTGAIYDLVKQPRKSTNSQATGKSKLVKKNNSSGSIY